MKIIKLVFLFLLVSFSMSAQELWTSASAKKSFMKTWGVEAEAEYRTHNAFKNSERFSIGVGGEYRQKFFKVDAGYKFIEGHTLEETTRKGNIVPPYWISRHRVYASITGKLKLGRFELSLRERYQFTHRVGKWVPKFDADGVTQKTDEWVSPKDKHVVRTRLGCDWNIRKSPFTPYANIEMYNAFGHEPAVEKIRYSVGSEYKINKKNRIELFYTFVQGVASGEPNANVIGIGYSFRL